MDIAICDRIWENIHTVHTSNFSNLATHTISKEYLIAVKFRNCMCLCLQHLQAWVIQILPFYCNVWTSSNTTCRGFFIQKGRSYCKHNWWREQGQNHWWPLELPKQGGWKGEGKYKSSPGKTKGGIWQKCHNPETFKVGALVLRKDTKRKKQAGGKLDFKWLGPYTIVKSMGRGLYQIQDVSDHTKQKLKVHGIHLKLFHPSTKVCSIMIMHSYALFVSNYIIST